jgi:hypothetical protein
MGGTEGKDGFDVFHKDPFVLAGKPRNKVCGKGTGEQDGNQGEAFREKVPFPYTVNKAAGRLVESLNAQAYTVYPSFPAGKEEGFVC